MTKTVRILTAVITTSAVTLYKQDDKGVVSTIVIQQGDVRARPIVEALKIPLTQNGFCDLDESLLILPEVPNSFKEFEKSSNGVVRFWKIAKSKIASFFGSETAPVDPLEPMTIGTLDSGEKKRKAIEEVMANAVPVSSANFNMTDVQAQRGMVNKNGETRKDDHNKESDSTHTIVAEVNGKLIPGVEKIHNQFERACKLGSSIGVTAFLERLSAVIDQRKHSVADLLSFMERGDMPIADDGSIIIYKVLLKQNGHYVDGHSQKVTQKIGSFVCMDQSLVDHDRRRDCSNGLHVARRGYISGFSGDVCVIAKLAPEDVIAVPQYDANKMRVCGYHILHELTSDQHQKLRQNKPITDTPEGKKLLGEIVAGLHVGKLEEVRITSSMGGGLKITPLVEAVATTEEIEQDQIGEIEEAEPVVREEEALETPVSPDQVIDAPINLLEAKKELAELKPKTKREIAQELLKKMQKADDASAEEKETAKALMDLKKAAKKSWDSLDISTSEAEEIIRIATK